MIRLFKKTIEKFITDKIPDPAKLVFFYGLAFCAGYAVGDFGYENYEDVAKVICTLSQPN